jgi:hypothetical protein
MSAAALLAMAMLPGAALRLELNLRRRASKKHPEPRKPRPELRMAPAGGYCQPRLFATADRKP